MTAEIAQTMKYPAAIGAIYLASHHFTSRPGIRLFQPGRWPVVTSNEDSRAGGGHLDRIDRHQIAYMAQKKDIREHRTYQSQRP